VNLEKNEYDDVQYNQHHSHGVEVHNVACEGRLDGVDSPAPPNKHFVPDVVLGKSLRVQV
jgi:hypothetical protein